MQTNVVPIRDVTVWEWPKGTAEPGFPILPYEDCVWLEQFVEEKSKGGIIIANTEHAKMPQGRVVAVGPGRLYVAALNAGETVQAAIFVPTRTKVGDVVMFGRYRTGGEPVVYNGKRYVMAREGDLGGEVVERKQIDVRLAPQE